jgi:hypothetical protein
LDFDFILKRYTSYPTGFNAMSINNLVALNSPTQSLEDSEINADAAASPVKVA